MAIQPDINIGCYHIHEQLGEGGMLVVYKVYDTRLESEVAIEFIRIEDFGSKEFARVIMRFQIEARSMAWLTHPNFVIVNENRPLSGRRSGRYHRKRMI